jgi:hypothetical protein
MALFEPLKNLIEMKEANRDPSVPLLMQVAVDAGAEVFGVADALTP